VSVPDPHLLVHRLHPLADLAQPRLTVVRSGGVGDTLLLVPTLRLLHECLPGADLTLVGSHWAAALRPLLPFPVEIVLFESAALTPLFGPDPDRDASGIFADADAVVFYTASPGEYLERNAERFCRGPVIDWPVMPRGDVPAAVHFARAVAAEPFGSSDLPEPPHAAVPEDLRLWGRTWIDGQLGAGTCPVAVHPGSGGRRKCWPADRFAGVAERLGRPVVLVEGPADAEACRAFLAHAPHGLAVARANDMTLPQAASLLACCPLFLGNDSGLSHLAAALGVPTVAVFGPTDPAVWAPPGGRVRAVAPASPGAWPAPGDVLDAIRALLATESANNT
jgi:heptosyltransferase-3